MSPQPTVCSRKATLLFRGGMRMVEFKVIVTHPAEYGIAVQDIVLYTGS
jgi:hypothetical protein